MALTFIDTNRLTRKATGQGDVAAVLNEATCGARNVEASLRWLKPAEKFTPPAGERHQLIYLMDGQGRIGLNGREYEVEKGAGIYLGPSETATIEAANGEPLKLFHLTVPRIPK
jgi:mannose-6-phosphate isomerase-like protein (cupin superfamily)